MEKEAQGFNKVHIISDHYTKESLKFETRTGKTGDKTVHYKISDDNVIEHLTTKQFLSNIKTKQDMTKYLSIKLYDVFQNVAFAVSHEFTYISNISDIDARLKDHCHKEADTYIVLHSLDVTKRNPLTDLIVYCCDTDVLLVLLHCFGELCSSTIFHTANSDIRLWTLSSHLGPELCTLLLGFHVLTG